MVLCLSTQASLGYPDSRVADLIQLKLIHIKRMELRQIRLSTILIVLLLAFAAAELPASARSTDKEIERAEFLFFHGDRLGAIEMLEKARDIDSDDADIHTRLLNLYVLEKMRKEAKEECRLLMKVKPDSSISYLMLANLEKEDNNLDTAIEILKSAPDDGKSRADFASLLGFCYLQAGKFSQAKSSFQKAITLDKKKIDASVGLAISQWREGDVESGLKTVDQVIASTPDMGDLRKLRGDMLAAAGKFEEALKELEIAKEKKVRNVHSSLGQIYLKQDRTAEAEAALRKATEQNVEDSLSFFLLGQIYEKNGKLDEAIKEYRNSAYLEKDKDTASKISARADALALAKRQKQPIILTPPKNHVEVFRYSYKDMIRLDAPQPQVTKGKK